MERGQISNFFRNLPRSPIRYSGGDSVGPGVG